MNSIIETKNVCKYYEVGDNVVKALDGIDLKIREVLFVFLSESALIGLIGGILGIILGSLIALIVSIASESLGFSLPFGVSPLIVIFGLIFSVLVGIISGLIPAREASKLDPVEALRR